MVFNHVGSFWLCAGKDAAMVTGRDGEARALFRSIGSDGAEWLFVVRSDGGWTITCDGKQVAAGTRDHASVDSGVRRFRAMRTALAESSYMRCSAASPISAV